MKYIKTGLCQEVDNSFVSWLTKWSFAMFIEIFPLLLNVISPVGLQVFEYLCPIPKLHNSTSNRKILLLLLFSSTFTFDFCRNQNAAATSPQWFFFCEFQIEFHLYQLIKSLCRAKVCNCYILLKWEQQGFMSCIKHVLSCFHLL